MVYKSVEIFEILNDLGNNINFVLSAL